MLGYDMEDGSMSAGLRTEQPLDLTGKFLVCEFFFSSLPTKICSPRACLATRKGVPVHSAILKAYTAGLNLTDSDAFAFIDVLPNRPGFSEKGQISYPETCPYPKAPQISKPCSTTSRLHVFRS